MNLMWAIYVADSWTPGKGTVILLSLLTVAMLFATVGFVIMRITPEASEEYQRFKTPYKHLCIVFSVVFLYYNAAPSKETAYKMLAAYGVEKVAQNPDVQRLAGKSLDVLEKAMDGYIKDSNPKK